MNRSLLIRDADVVFTLDDTRRELRGGHVLVQGPAIAAVYAAAELPPGLQADEVIDARGHAVLPGLVNTHHHMYQSLTRAVPAAQDAELFGWLRTLHGCDLGPAEMGAREALALATRGGAQVLGRDDIGHLAPGMSADLALFDLRGLGLAGGAVHDPVAALLFCQPPQAAYTVVNGRVVVREGRLTTLDLQPLLHRHNQLARQLVNRA